MVKRICILLLMTICGCATYSSNLKIGNEQNYVSLKDQRSAIKTVKIYKKPPEGAIILGVVRAGRCHRNFMQTAPTKSQVLTDLKISAYIKGADGITRISIEEKSGLLKNCWSILDGRAVMFTLPDNGSSEDK